MKRYAEGGMSADTEADLQALKTLKQPDYDVGGPKQRNMPRRKKDKSVSDRLKATAFKALNRTVGKVADLPFEGYQRFSDFAGMPDEAFRAARERARKQNLEREEGAYFKKGGSVKKYAGGGSVSSASKRADGCAMKGKTRGKFV
jgi:hypothetical protein